MPRWTTFRGISAPFWRWCSSVAAATTRSPVCSRSTAPRCASVRRSRWTRSARTPRSLPSTSTASPTTCSASSPTTRPQEVRDVLADSPTDRAWARVVSSELAPLAGDNPLPEIPVERSTPREPDARGARAGGRSRTDSVRRAGARHARASRRPRARGLRVGPGPRATRRRTQAPSRPAPQARRDRCRARQRPTQLAARRRGGDPRRRHRGGRGPLLRAARRPFQAAHRLDAGDDDLERGGQRIVDAHVLDPHHRDIGDQRQRGGADQPVPALERQEQQDRRHRRGPQRGQHRRGRHRRPERSGQHHQAAQRLRGVALQLRPRTPRSWASSTRASASRAGCRPPGRLPTNASHYKQLIVTVETTASPKQPGVDHPPGRADRPVAQRRRSAADPRQPVQRLVEP